MNRNSLTSRRLPCASRIAALCVCAGSVTAPSWAQADSRTPARPTSGIADLIDASQLPSAAAFTSSATRRMRVFALDYGTRGGVIRWSYIPDGTDLEDPPVGPYTQTAEPDTNFVPGKSKLFAVLGSPAPVGFGDQRTWQTIVANAFDRWEAISGIQFEFVGDERISDNENGDSGDRWDQNAPAYPTDETTGIGDIRIAMRDLDGVLSINGSGGVNLGFTYDPFEPPLGDEEEDPDPMTPGDEITNLGYLSNIILDEDERWNDPFTPNLFATVIARQIGYAIGLAPACPNPDYSTPSSIESTVFALMQNQEFNVDTGVGDPYPQLLYQGPQQDDLLAVQYAYGDPFEDNNSYAISTEITYSPAPGTNVFTYAPHIAGQPFANPTQFSISGRGPGTPAGVGITPFILPTAFDLDRYRIGIPQTVTSCEFTLTIEPVGTPYIDGAYDAVLGTCDPVTLAVDPRNNQDLSFRVESFDPFTNTLTTIITQNLTGIGESETVTLPLDAGIYFITVVGDNSDNVQLYNMTLTIVTPQAQTGEDFDAIVDNSGADAFEAIGATGFEVTYGNLDGAHIADHDVFAGREITRISWPGVQPAVTLSSSHPTTVAGVAVGDTADGFRGLARDAEIVSGAIATEIFADGTFSIGKNALYYALLGMADKNLSEQLGLFQPVSVISSTFAAGGRTPNGEDAISQAIDSVASMTGVTIVAAAGNNGQAERQSFPNCMFTNEDPDAPGTDFLGSRSVTSPATSFNAISVGALGSSDGAEFDIVAGFSGRGPIDANMFDDGLTDQLRIRAGVHIVAPGTGVTPIPPDFMPAAGEPPDPCTYNGPIPTTFISLPGIAPTDDPDAPADPAYFAPAQGTSVAAAFVAGGVALLQDAGRIQNPPLATHSTVMKAILLNGAEKLPGWANTGVGPGVPQDQRDGFRGANEAEIPGIINMLGTTFPLDVAQGAGRMNLQRSLENYITGYAPATPPQATFEGPTIDPPETDPTVPTMTMPDEPEGSGIPGTAGRSADGADEGAASVAEPAPLSAIEVAKVYRRLRGAQDSPGDWTGRSQQYRIDPDLKSGRGPAGVAVNTGPQTPFELPNLGGGPGPGSGGGPPQGPPGSIKPGVRPREIEPIFVDPIGWDFANIDQRSIRLPQGGTQVTGYIDYIINVPLLATRPDPEEPGAFLNSDLLTVTLCWNRTLELENTNLSNPNDPRIGSVRRERFENLDLLVFETDEFGNPTGPAARSSTSVYENTEHVFMGIPRDGLYLIRVQWVGQNYDVMNNSPFAEQPFAVAWRVDFGPRATPNRPTDMNDLLGVLNHYGSRVGRGSNVLYSLDADYNKDGRIDFRDISDVIANWGVN